MTSSTTPRQLLILSGLDPAGGAGFLLDARVAERHGVRPVGVLTAQTVQTTTGVHKVEPIDPELLEAQLTALLSDIEVHAVKIGMLCDDATAKAVSTALAQTAAQVVWDPVRAPSLGSEPLYRGDLRRACEHLAPHLTIVTPNLDEAAALVGFPVESPDDMRRAAQQLAALCGGAALVKAGHLPGDLPATDMLFADGRAYDFPADRVPGNESIHGTGCALSTALACRLALGDQLPAAARAAIAFNRSLMAASVHPGRGRPSVM